MNWVAKTVIITFYDKIHVSTIEATIVDILDILWNVPRLTEKRSKDSGRVNIFVVNTY